MASAPAPRGAHDGGMKQAACVLGVIALLGAGCSGRATQVGVGIGVGVAASSCIPLVVEGDGSIGPPMLALTGGFLGGAIVVGALIGYAIGALTSSDPPASSAPLASHTVPAY